MRISKISLLLSLSLLTSTSAYCMDVPEDLFHPKKLILVHASTVMAINNEKIAGARCHKTDGTSFIEPQGTNLQKRITYHNCLNGIVPEDRHGLASGSSGLGIPSGLGTNKDACAYLDSLNAFEGEIIGGVPDDFMTIHSHTYGEASTIVVPQHRIDEFKEKNPSFRGMLISFDPEKISLREEVDRIIKEVLKAPTLSEINDINNRENFVKFCKHNHYSYKEHDDTPFFFLEMVEKYLHNTISYINRQCQTTPLLPADQVEPLTIVIETLLEHIQEKLSSKLSPKMNFAVTSWVEDTKNWLVLFKRDAVLRLNENKSFFKNHLGFEKIQEIISKRQDVAFLDRISHELPSIESTTNVEFVHPIETPVSSFLLLDKSTTPFPPNAIEKVSNLPLSYISKLCMSLNKRGYTAHGAEITLEYFMKHFQSNDEIKKAKIFNNGGELFSALLNNLSPSDQLRERLTKWAWSALQSDTSFRNHTMISLFNSKPGKALRQKIFGEASPLDFSTLLRLSPETNFLFKNLEEDKSFEEKLGSRYFTEIVRAWLLQRARQNNAAGITLKSETLAEELRDATCSLFNFSCAQSFVLLLKSYQAFGLETDIRHPDNALQHLIELGCFKSWEDIVRRVCNVKAISEDEFLTIWKNDDFVEQLREGLGIDMESTLSIGRLSRKIDSYIEKRQENQETFKQRRPVYEIFANEIETAGEGTIKLDFWGLDSHIDLLTRCLNGYTQEVGKNKVTIFPNIEGAKILYAKLLPLASPEEKEQLDKLMEGVMKEK